MNPWTSLLESLHSSLIDELCERHPEPKPELGMPLRKTSFSLPDPTATAIVVCEIAQQGTHGIAAIAMSADCAKKLGIGPRDLWEALIRRAAAEFARRQIKPSVNRLIEVKDTAALPKGYPEPKRMIWIPVKFPCGSCYLGMGV